jgi:hypothetical protein
VGGDAGEERLRLVAPQQGPGQVLRRQDRAHAELEEGHRVAGRPQGEAQEVRREVVPVLDERTDQAPPAAPVAERRRRLVHGAQEDGSAVAAQGVGGLHLGLEPLEAVAGQGQLGEEG